jgi:hypothetical protein
MANESFARPAIAGFLSVRRARLPMLGHNTAPSVVLHPHRSPRVPLQSQGPHLHLHYQEIFTYPWFNFLIRSVPPPSQHQLAFLPPPASRAAKEKDRPPSPLGSSSPRPPSVPRLSEPPAPASSTGPSTGSESRRRNAEQRAAQLRADPLLAQVEPHRVFCALCRKWVQLRQDSTFCAYPWQQHRSKCVIRQSVASIFFGLS